MVVDFLFVEIANERDSVFARIQTTDISYLTNETTNEVSKRDSKYGSESSPQCLHEYKRLSEQSTGYMLICGT